MEKGEVQTRLEAVAEDAMLVCQLCTEGHSGYEEYQLLERMLSVQTKGGQLEPNKEISPKAYKTRQIQMLYIAERQARGIRDMLPMSWKTAERMGISLLIKIMMSIYILTRILDRK
jgi:hypothetical protein